MSSYWGKRSPPFAVQAGVRNGVPVWVVEGRAFTESELKKAIICASGGYVGEFYFRWESMLLWEVIEAIEIAADVNKPKTDDVNLFDLLTVEPTVQ